MKKLLLLPMFVISLAFNSKAQTQTLKTSPISFAVGYYNACFEKAVAERSTIEVSGGYFSKALGIDVSAGSFTLGYKKYFSNRTEGIEGFYYMPNLGLSFGSVNELSSGVTVTGNSSYKNFNAGVLFGYQLISNSGFTLDSGLGLSYTNYGNNSVLSGRSIGPDIKFGIGYAW